MTFDLIVRNATLPDGRKSQDVAVAGGRIAAIGPGLEADAGETIDARGHLLVAAVRRLPLPHGRDAVAGPAAPEPVRHAARRHRAVGRIEAAPHARGGRRAGAALLRPRRLARACSRSAATSTSATTACSRSRRFSTSGSGEALSRPPARRVPAGRLSPLADRRQQSRARARPRRRRRRRHPAFRAHDGRRRGLGAAPCARSPPGAASPSTCTATRATTRCRATSRRSPPRPSGSAWERERPDRT